MTHGDKQRNLHEVHQTTTRALHYAKANLPTDVRKNTRDSLPANKQSDNARCTTVFFWVPTGQGKKTNSFNGGVVSVNQSKHLPQAKRVWAKTRLLRMAYSLVFEWVDPKEWKQALLRFNVLMENKVSPPVAAQPAANPCLAQELFKTWARSRFAINSGMVFIKNFQAGLHRDKKDDKNAFIGTVAKGNFTGGELVLPEAQVIIEQRPGYLLLCRSSRLIHYVRPFKGTRRCVVMFNHIKPFANLDIDEDGVQFNERYQPAAGPSKPLAKSKKAPPVKEAPPVEVDNETSQDKAPPVDVDNVPFKDNGPLTFSDKDNDALSANWRKRCVKVSNNKDEDAHRPRPCASQRSPLPSPLPKVVPVAPPAPKPCVCKRKAPNPDAAYRSRLPKPKKAPEPKYASIAFSGGR